MDFHQPVTVARFRSNPMISSLPTNILNEILEIINQEIGLKINTYRDQMLNYAQEIDEKLSNCKDSRNKYYQICQQLTAKYAKLKKKYEHLYTRYQSYKARNKELFALLQYLSTEDIRVQHNILKYQNKFKSHTNTYTIHNNVNNNINNIHILPTNHLNISSKMRETSDSHSHIPSPSSAISSETTLFPTKRHSKSKTVSSVPRNSLPSGVSNTNINNIKSNPFKGYNSYKRISDSSGTTHTLSVENMAIQPLLLRSSANSNTSSNRMFQLRLQQSQSHQTPLPHTQHTHSHNHGELEGYGNSAHTSISISDDMHSHAHSHIQPVAMAASLFINKPTLNQQSQSQPRQTERVLLKNKSRKIMLNVYDEQQDESDEYDHRNILFRQQTQMHVRDLNSMSTNMTDDSHEMDIEFAMGLNNPSLKDRPSNETVEEREQIVIDVHNMDNEQSNTSTLKPGYSRSHSSSVVSNSEFSDEEASQQNTQTYYYEQLKLTPVPNKKVIDKNRLIGILQNLPNTNRSKKSIIEIDEMSDRDSVDHINEYMNDLQSVSRSLDMTETIIEDSIQSNHSLQKQHSRGMSSQMSFPDIDKINMSINPSVNEDEMLAIELENEQKQSEISTKKAPNNDSKYEQKRSHSGGSKQRIMRAYNQRNGNTINKHVRSSTCGSRGDYIDTPRNKAHANITGKTIKLFYRFGSKSYPPIMAKTTNTICQLRSMIASALQNVDSNKLLISHRGHGLNNMDLTLSQCDIAKYDTIIAKIDITRSLFSPPPFNRRQTSTDTISSNMTSPARPQSTKSEKTFNQDPNGTPAPINVKRNSKGLWTPGKTPHSVGSLTTTAHHTPVYHTPVSRRLSGIHNHNTITIRPRQSQLFDTVNGLDQFGLDSYIAYPLSPNSDNSDQSHNDNNTINDNSDQSQTENKNMSSVLDKMSSKNNMTHTHTPTFKRKEMSENKTETMNDSENHLQLRNPLFNISRPVSMRRYNDSAEYPFSVCPPSIVAQSPKNSKQKRNSILAMNTYNNKPMPLPMSKPKKRMSRVRFSNDTKYNGNDSLELRRNLSRSLDVIAKNRAINDSNQKESGASFSPLPSRRRTQKLENPPLIKLVHNGRNKNKKSKSMSLLKNYNEPNPRLKRRSFTHKGTKMGGIMEIEIPEIASMTSSHSSHSSHSHSSHSPSHSNESNSSRESTIPPMFVHNETRMDSNDMNELSEDAILQLQRDVSREDLVSDNISNCEEFPNFNERERRKTIEMRKAPVIH